MMRNGRLTDTQRKILAKMEELGTALKPKKIAEETGIPHQTVKQAMRMLILTKYVTQKKRKGEYTLTRNGE